MNDSLFDILIQNGFSERLDKDLLKNTEYIELQEKLDLSIKEFDNLDLDEEMQLIIDRMVTCYNDSGSFYGILSYKQGFYDCIMLLKEIGIL